MKKIFAMIVIVCLMVTVLCATAFATDGLGLIATASATSHTHDAMTYEPMGQNGLQNEGNYYLTGDVSLGDVTINGTVNLCLNSYVLTAESITVSAGATFNVWDCGTTGHKYQSSNSGPWTSSESGDQTIKGGICNLEPQNRNNEKRKGNHPIYK